MYQARSHEELIQKWTNVTDEDGNRSVLAIDENWSYEKKAAIATVLENQVDGDGQLVIGEAAQANTTLSSLGGSTDGSADSDAYQFQPIALALARRAMPRLFAFNTCGVQPMQGPVGLAFAMRVIYKSNNADGIEAGWDKMNEWSGYTGSTSQTSAVLNDGFTSATGAASTSAETWELGAGGSYPELTTEWDKKTIEAVARQVGSTISMFAQQDIRAMHGVDLEREMVSRLEYELVAGLDREILAKIKSAATNTALGGEVISAVNVSGTNLDGRWSQEKFSNMINAIVHQQGRIASLTRLGNGNFVVVSPAVATALQSAPPGVFTRSAAAVSTFNGLPEIGTLNAGSMKVYFDSYASTDYALVGFKGEEASQAGVIYSPYLSGVRKTVAEKDFSTVLGAHHRYALTDSLLDSGRFYRYIPFTNVSSIIATA